MVSSTVPYLPIKCVCSVILKQILSAVQVSQFKKKLQILLLWKPNQNSNSQLTVN